MYTPLHLPSEAADNGLVVPKRVSGKRPRTVSGFRVSLGFRVEVSFR